MILEEGSSLLLAVRHATLKKTARDSFSKCFFGNADPIGSARGHFPGTAREAQAKKPDIFTIPEKKSRLAGVAAPQLKVEVLLQHAYHSSSC